MPLRKRNNWEEKETYYVSIQSIICARIYTIDTMVLVVFLFKFQTQITWPTRPSLRYSRDMDSSIFSLLSSSSDSSDVAPLPTRFNMHDKYFFRRKKMEVLENKVLCKYLWKTFFRFGIGPFGVTTYFESRARHPPTGLQELPLTCVGCWF